MKRHFISILGCFLLMSASVQSQTKVPVNSDDGFTFVAADSSFSTTLTGRIQSLYRGTYNLQNDKYNDGFVVRRARVKMEGFVVHPTLEYKIELGFSSQDIAGATIQNSNTSNILLDAVAKWKFAPGFNLWFGQTKLPGNRERVVSSQKLQFVDRSLLNSRFNLDRDLGLQLHHESVIGRSVFRQIGSISMGEGRNITTGNAGGYDYTGRLEFLPFGKFKGGGDYSGSDLKRETTPKLSLAVTYDYNNDASREQGQLGQFFNQTRDLKTIFADAMFKYQGFSAMAEYADRRTNGSPVLLSDVNGTVTESFFTGTGFNIQAGYLFKNNLELAGRFTVINPEALTQRDKNNQYTLGLSKYLAEHKVKVQTDLSLLRQEDNFNELLYRLQLEIGF